MTEDDHEVHQVIPRDAIPSVDDPAFVDAYPGDPDDEVIVLDLGSPETPSPAREIPSPAREIPSPARAYPVRYLRYHEIVNDALGCVPIAVTWCPLCGAAAVYDRRVVADEDTTRTLTFGVSGKLADDDLVMYDRETESEWKQSSGRALDGTFEDASLRTLPAAMTTWRQFAEEHPDGDVLAAPGGESEAAGAGDAPEPIDYDEHPYRAYLEGDGFGLGAHRGTGGRSWDRDDVAPKTPVVGVEDDDDALAFPLSIVLGGTSETEETSRGVVTATVGVRDVVVFAVGDELHAFDDPGHEWRPVPGGFRATRSDGSGVLYDGRTGTPVDAPAAHTGAAGKAGGADADPLSRVPTKRLFAFAWRDDHGDAFYTG